MLDFPKEPDEEDELNDGDRHDEKENCDDGDGFQFAAGVGCGDSADWLQVVGDPAIMVFVALVESGRGLVRSKALRAETG